ncbi:hypothetical protein [Lacticaseibacillus nasuensis]|uniref:hypothetical protein n=1 Tax=Lacticaseibacillus nasuensis TaxID=944671 RepID=UPI000A4D4401
MARSSERKRDITQAAAFVLPMLLVLLIFTLFPIFYSLYLSFNKVNLVGDVSYNFVGFKNFTNAITDERVIIALKKHLKVCCCGGSNPEHLSFSSRYGIEFWHPVSENISLSFVYSNINIELGTNFDIHVYLQFKWAIK